MRIEIIKKQTLKSPRPLYWVYADGNFVTLFVDEKQARDHVAEMENMHLHPEAEEIIYSKEI